MPNTYRFTNCQLNSLAACAIVAVRFHRLKPTLDHQVTGVESRTFEYKIFVGGPTPCNCRVDTIRAAAYAFSPTEPGDVALPFPGQIIQDVADPTLYLAVKSVRFRVDEARKDCRVWIAEVAADNQCFANQSFYTVEGALITQLANLPLAAARITRRKNSREIPCEAAEFRGMYKRTGEEYTDCEFAGSLHCCRPMEAMEIGQEYPPVNAAGIAFDPPMMRDQPEVSYVLEKPFFAVNGCMLDRLEHLVNCESFWLTEYVKGRMTFCAYVREGTARIENINVTPIEFCDGTPIVMVAIELRIRSNKVYGLVEDDERPVVEFGWDELVANKGFGALLCPGDGDAFGGLFVPGGETEAVHGFASTQLITDAQGNPVEDAQWLDCNGRPLNLAATQYGSNEGCRFGIKVDDLLYIRYRKHPWVSFTDADILPGFLDTGIFAEKPEMPDGYPADPCECDAEDLDKIYVCSTTSTTPE